MTYLEKLKKIYNEFPELRGSFYNEWVYYKDMKYHVVWENNGFNPQILSDEGMVENKEIDDFFLKKLKEDYRIDGVYYPLHKAIIIIKQNRIIKDIMKKEGFGFVFDFDFLTEEELNVKDILE